MAGKSANRNRILVFPERKRREERDFEKFYRESFSTVYGWVRSRVNNESDAEDIVSEAFLNAARSFSSFDSARAKFSTWVISIARNCMASHFRRQKPQASLDDVSDAVFAVEGGQSDVDDQLTVERFLACLDENERELVILKYREDMRNVDIAEELSMNPSTVSTMLSRAIEKRRKLASKTKRFPE